MFYLEKFLSDCLIFDILNIFMTKFLNFSNNVSTYKPNISAKNYHLKNSDDFFERVNFIQSELINTYILFLIFSEKMS